MIEKKNVLKDKKLTLSYGLKQLRFDINQLKIVNNALKIAPK